LIEFQDEIEMEDINDLDTSRSFCVERAEAKSFLETLLTTLGLLPQEIDDCLRLVLEKMTLSPFTLVQLLSNDSPKQPRLLVSPR
jgi:hypothetical protein